jgi:putative heme iron utilization protein
MEPSTEAIFQALLALPVASLGTLHEGAPFVSMVPVAPAPEGDGYLIHVSRLAQHTRDLETDGRVSLLLTAPLDPGLDPLALPRLSLQGQAEAVVPNSSTHQRAAETYLARFPQSELTLGLGDFSFFLIRPETGRLVSGFGRALSLDREPILRALAQASKKP